MRPWLRKSSTTKLIFIGANKMNKSDFNGFHNSFNAYCNWCEKQSELRLPTMSWGKWWDSLGMDIFNKEVN